MDLDTHVETYIVFQKTSNGKIVNMSYPILNEEIQSIVVEEFGNSKDAEVLQESIFKMIYYQSYQENFQLAWKEFLDTFLVSLDSQFHYELDEEDDQIIAEWFTIVRNPENQSELSIFFSLDADPALCAFLVKNLTLYTYNIFDVLIGESYYYSAKEDQIYFGEDAYYKKLIENPITLN